MERGSRVARLLMEALPYIRRFHGQTVVIKYGGNAMKDEALKEAFARNVAMLKFVGVNPVIVHGGGPQIGKMLERLDIPTCFRNGQRVTDEAAMDIVEMVLVGQVNKQIVNLLNQHGGRAVGLSGKDGRLITARKKNLYIEHKDAPPELVDLGRVGEVVRVGTSLIRSLEGEGFIPVIAPVGVDENGETYNINADTVAGAVAAALKARRLILLTDVPGLLDKEGSLMSSLTVPGAVEAMQDGTISGGMIPKMQSCLDALSAGVEKAHIIDGRLENSLILELFTKAGVSTEIVSTNEWKTEYPGETFVG